MKPSSSVESLHTSPVVPLASPAIHLESPLVLGSNPYTFAWEDYLAETGSLAAPQVCFKQVYFLFYCAIKAYSQLTVRHTIYYCNYLFTDEFRK